MTTLSADCPVPGIFWITLPDHIADQTLGSYNVMLRIRQEFPGLVVNTLGNRYLWIMKRWPA